MPLNPHFAFPRYDPRTDTFSVDWPGRPPGPVPTFDSYEAAREYILSQNLPIHPRTESKTDND